MTERGGATKQQRGYIIGLTRTLNDTLGLDSLVVSRIERKAKVGTMSEDEAARLIDALKEFIFLVDTEGKHVGVS
jgi:hypothetical protein